MTLGTQSFADRFDDYRAFLRPRLVEAYRVLTPTGSLYFHIDYREVHYCKVLLDDIFGRECFLNEIIWAYDYGARTRKKWPAKHDNILLYVKDPDCYTFNVDDIDRIPYMAPGLVGPEKAARGKLPTDTWWHTIVSPNGREKTGYPTQKPLGILERIIRASSNPGDVVLDFFAGSGTTGVAAAQLGRSFILIDNNAEALRVMGARLADLPATFVERHSPRNMTSVHPPPSRRGRARVGARATAPLAREAAQRLQVGRVRTLPCRSPALPRRMAGCRIAGWASTAAKSASPMVPWPMFSWRSRFVPNGTLESLAWTKRSRDSPTVRSQTATVSSSEPVC